MDKYEYSLVSPKKELKMKKIPKDLFLFEPEKKQKLNKSKDNQIYEAQTNFNRHIFAIEKLENLIFQEFNNLLKTVFENEVGLHSISWVQYANNGRIVLEQDILLTINDVLIKDVEFQSEEETKLALINELHYLVDFIIFNIHKLTNSINSIRFLGEGRVFYKMQLGTLIYETNY